MSKKGGWSSFDVKVGCRDLAADGVSQESHASCHSDGFDAFPSWKEAVVGE